MFRLLPDFQKIGRIPVNWQDPGVNGTGQKVKGESKPLQAPNRCVRRDLADFSCHTTRKPSSKATTAA